MNIMRGLGLSSTRVLGGAAGSSGAPGGRVPGLSEGPQLREGGGLGASWVGNPATFWGVKWFYELSSVSRDSPGIPSDSVNHRESPSDNDRF